jgi:hypothetical protein
VISRFFTLQLLAVQEIIGNFCGKEFWLSWTRDGGAEFLVYNSLEIRYNSPFLKSIF